MSFMKTKYLSVLLIITAFTACKNGEKKQENNNDTVTTNNKEKLTEDTLMQFVKTYTLPLMTESGMKEAEQIDIFDLIPNNDVENQLKTLLQSQFTESMFSNLKFTVIGKLPLQSKNAQFYILKEELSHAVLYWKVYHLISIKDNKLYDAQLVAFDQSEAGATVYTLKTEIDDEIFSTTEINYNFDPNAKPDHEELAKQHTTRNMYEIILDEGIISKMNLD